MVVNELGDSVTDSSPGWDECHLLQCGLVSTSSDEPAKRDQWNGYSHDVCFLAERLGSGDGERKTLLTRQIAFEPLPASVLFALVGCVVAVMRKLVVNQGLTAKLCRLTSAATVGMRCSSAQGKPRLL